MFVINLTGENETVRLSEIAGLICLPRDASTLTDLLDKYSETERAEMTMDDLAVALAEDVIVDWYGLGNEQKQKIEFDPKLIAPVMSDPVVLRAFSEQYLSRLLYVRDEGNGSMPSPNGTSAADATTAKPATKRARRAPTKRKSRAVSKAARSGT